jgi:hypothetical protein
MSGSFFSWIFPLHAANENSWRHDQKMAQSTGLPFSVSISRKVSNTLLGFSRRVSMRWSKVANNP